MKFEIKKRKIHEEVKSQYPDEDFKTAYEFAKECYKEFENFLKAIVLFGSRSRKTGSGKGDIDIMNIVDDVTVILSPEMVQAYRVISEKLILKHSTRIHLTTLKFSTFWEYVRAGDPIAINILRDGLSLLDTGFFDVLQVLLRQGRIRPTTESMWSYYTRAPATLFNSKWHLLQATLDLYWAVIDSAHAALIKIGEIPPSPSHVPDIMKEKLVKEHKIPAKYANTMKEFYDLSKMITHRQIREIKGPEYDKYYAKAKDFVDRMKEFIEKK